ncbi:MAG: DoxX family protein [Gemmatimonadaceae bacterium]
MEYGAHAGPVSKRQLWTGRALNGVAALFMVFDTVIHAMKPPAVVQGFGELGLPLRAAIPLSTIEFVCIVLYVIPRTSALGAILLTRYLGGAVAVQVRIGAPLFSNVFAPVYIALLLWGEIYLRDERVRAIIPVRR